MSCFALTDGVNLAESFLFSVTSSAVRFALKIETKVYQYRPNAGQLNRVILRAIQLRHSGKLAQSQKFMTAAHPSA
jgi:hypothetical protein